MGCRASRPEDTLSTTQNNAASSVPAASSGDLRVSLLHSEGGDHEAFREARTLPSRVMHFHLRVAVLGRMAFSLLKVRRECLNIHSGLSCDGLCLSACCYCHA